MRLQRDCLELAEVVEDWEVTEAEIRHLVATGALKLSVRLVGQRVTLLAQQGGGSDEPCWVPSGKRAFIWVRREGIAQATPATERTRVRVVSVTGL